MKILSTQPFASPLATALSVPLISPKLKRCDNGELLVCIDQSLVHKQNIVIVDTLDCPVNSSLMDLLLMIDAVKSAQPESLTLVLPYHAYGRQNHPTHDSAGSAAQLVMRLLAMAGIDELVTVDIHHPNILKEAPFKVCALTAVPLFAELIRLHNPTPIIIAPDKGSADRAKDLAEHLKTDWTVLSKKRLENGDIIISSPDVFQKRDCIIIDDIVDSGKTLCLAADYLIKRGAGQIDAFVTHGIFGKGCLERLNQSSSLKSLTITNTVPITMALGPKITCADITPVLVEGLTRLDRNRFFSERNQNK